MLGAWAGRGQLDASLDVARGRNTQHPSGRGLAQRSLAQRSLAQGVELVSSSVVRPSDALGGAQVLSYLPSIVALAQARRRGAHEALILSREGYVLEGASSNVFALREGVLCTPPTSDSILPGITRQVVMDAARALELPVEERRLTPGELASADEVLLSSSLRELVPVVSLDGTRRNQKTDQLNQTLRACSAT